MKGKKDDFEYRKKKFGKNWSKERLGTRGVSEKKNRRVQHHRMRRREIPRQTGKKAEPVE